MPETNYLHDGQVYSPNGRRVKGPPPPIKDEGDPMSDKPVWVPIALPEDEARATLNALRAVFTQLTTLGKASEAPELARAMMRVAEACDKAREEAAARA